MVSASFIDDRVLFEATSEVCNGHIVLLVYYKVFNSISSMGRQCLVLNKTPVFHLVNDRLGFISCTVAEVVSNHQKQIIANCKGFDGYCSFGGNLLKLFKKVKTLLTVCG